MYTKPYCWKLNNRTIREGVDRINPLHMRVNPFGECVCLDSSPTGAQQDVMYALSCEYCIIQRTNCCTLNISVGKSINAWLNHSLITKSAKTHANDPHPTEDKHDVTLSWMWHTKQQSNVHMLKAEYYSMNTAARISSHFASLICKWIPFQW